MGEPIHEARDLVTLAGMSSFRPNGSAYEASDDPLYQQELVPLVAIRPIVRGPGVANFGVDRALDILEAIQTSKPLPPIRVQLATVPSEPYKFKLYDGVHRYHLSLALGFTHIVAAIMSELDVDAF